MKTNVRSIKVEVDVYEGSLQELTEDVNFAIYGIQFRKRVND